MEKEDFEQIIPNRTRAAFRESWDIAIHASHSAFSTLYDILGTLPNSGTKDLGCALAHAFLQHELDQMRGCVREHTPMLDQLTEHLVQWLRENND